MMDLNRIVDDAKYWMLTNTLHIRTLTHHHCSDGRFARKPGLACSPQFLRPFTPEKNLWKKSSCSATYVCWQRGNVHICPVLLQQSTDISCVPGLQQEICCSRFAAVGPCCDRQTDRQTDGQKSDWQTPYCFTDPALHTVQGCANKWYGILQHHLTIFFFCHWTPKASSPMPSVMHLIQQLIFGILLTDNTLVVYLDIFVVC